MNSFLSSTKAALTELTSQFGKCKHKPIHLAIGNQACDLDSCVSAVSYAWMKSKLTPGILHVPVMNLERNLFRLRTEVNYIFKELSVEPEHIVFLYNLNLSLFKKLSKDDLTITLLDHHFIQTSNPLIELKSYVTEIIDHRPITHDIPSTIETNIYQVGSCSTLITERILHHLTRDQLIPEIITLTLGAILVDTDNLTAGSKVTPRDVHVVEQMLQISNRNKRDLNALYTSLTKAKFFIEGLNAQDMLLKDPKIIENPSNTFRVMFSTLHQDQKSFFQREDAKNAILSNLETQNLQSWISLSSASIDHEGYKYKPIAVHCPNDEQRERITTALIEAESLDIRLDTDSSERFNYCIFLRMYNCKATRKQLLPVVENLLQS
ncbi:exopolyphosphatase PRUNE1-like [Ciona intestinalis]